MYFLLKMGKFRCYVRLPECTIVFRNFVNGDQGCDFVWKRESDPNHCWEGEWQPWNISLCFLLPMNLFPENGTTTLRQSSWLSSINTIAHLQYSLRIQVHPKEGITQPESDDEIGTVKPLPRMGLHSLGFTHCVENNNPQKSSCNCIITDHARRQVIWATKKNNPRAFHWNTGCFIKEILK